MYKYAVSTVGCKYCITEYILYNDDNYCLGPCGVIHSCRPNNFSYSARQMNSVSLFSDTLL